MDIWDHRRLAEYNGAAAGHNGRQIVRGDTGRLGQRSGSVSPQPPEVTYV
jgi:hypothetical protein